MGSAKKFWTLLLTAAGIAALALPALANGYTPDPQTQSHSEAKREAQRAAENTLEALRNAYLSKSLDRFFQRASEEPYFSHSDLKVRLGSQFSRHDALDLRFDIDHAISEGDKVVLKTHWHKRLARRDNGQVEIQEGHADFVFRQEDGQTRLLDIQKDNPF